MTPSTAVSIDEVLLALRSIPGIRSADIGDDDSGGAGLLRLDLAADVDEVEVATSVGRLLRERFGLGVDAGQVQMVEAAADFAPADGRCRRVRRPRRRPRHGHERHERRPQGDGQHRASPR